MPRPHLSINWSHPYQHPAQHPLVLLLHPDHAHPSIAIGATHDHAHPSVVIVATPRPRPPILGQCDHAHPRTLGHVNTACR